MLINAMILLHVANVSTFKGTLCLRNQYLIHYSNVLGFRVFNIQQLVKVVLNVQEFVVNVAKCTQSCPYKLLIQYNYTKCKQRQRAKIVQ
jgi:hypothetical protein